MKATNLILEIGLQDIPISLYKAVDDEPSFKRITNCCNAPMGRKDACTACGKELSKDDTYPAIKVGKDEFKKVSDVKLEDTNMKVLGVTDKELEIDGYIKNGMASFVYSQKTKKKDRNFIKFAYLRESLKESGKSLVCIYASHGKEKIVLLKPYGEGFIGLGICYPELVRNIEEIENYGESCEIDRSVVSEMALNLKSKPNVVLSDILNRRIKIIEEMILDEDASIPSMQMEQELEEEINPKELLNF